MDPNAKPATICKKGHPRIWYTTRECPMCESVAYGKRISDKLSQAVETGKTWQRVADDLKAEILKCEAENERLYRLQDPEAHAPAAPWHVETEKCGFDRNGSHNAGRYVCTCGWGAGGPVGLVIESEDSPDEPTPEQIAVAKEMQEFAAQCAHPWPGPGPVPDKFMCKCGTKVYRSYEDYCWD